MNAPPTRYGRNMSGQSHVSYSVLLRQTCEGISSENLSILHRKAAYQQRPWTSANNATLVHFISFLSWVNQWQRSGAWMGTSKPHLMGHSSRSAGTSSLNPLFWSSGGCRQKDDRRKDSFTANWSPRKSLVAPWRRVRHDGHPLISWCCRHARVSHI